MHEHRSKKGYDPFSGRRIAILISGRGSNMAALIAAAKAQAYPAEIALVVSNEPNAALTWSKSWPAADT